MNPTNLKNLPSSKFKTVKVIIKSNYRSFDNPEMNKTTISEQEYNFNDVKDLLNKINEECDGEMTHEAVLIYDLFDNEPYSVSWLEGSF